MIWNKFVHLNNIMDSMQKKYMVNSNSRAYLATVYTLQYKSIALEKMLLILFT